MELLLTGDFESRATEAGPQCGLARPRVAGGGAGRGAVLAIAERMALIPTEIQQINKRSVHRAMEIMGMRAAIRAGTELQALADAPAVGRGSCSRTSPPT